MAELLQYRASNSAVFYVPPKRFEARALTIGAGVAGLVIAIGACVYAFILPELLSIYLRLFFSLGFRSPLGLPADWPSDMGGSIRR